MATLRSRRRWRGRKWRRQRWQLIALLLTIGVAFLGVVSLIAVAWFALGERAAPNVVARVLFSETANCTRSERALVAGVMQNRIGQRAFGGGRNLEEVVRQPGAFSCIDDASNTNWAKTRNPDRLTLAEHAIWVQCLALATGPIPSAIGPSGRALVYYHDKRITMPANWNNAGWHAVREITTTRFVFYSIVPAGK